MSFFFWTLTLMFVLLCGVSADQAVSLKCNQTVNVMFGENLTLRCDIEQKEAAGDCEIVSVEWNDKVGNLCEKNTCYSDSKTFLQMTNVTEEKNITVKILANCGMDSTTIRVMVNHAVPPNGMKTSNAIKGGQNETIISLAEEKWIPIVLAAVFAVIIGLIVVGVVVYKRKGVKINRVTYLQGTISRSVSF